MQRTRSIVLGVTLLLLCAAIPAAYRLARSSALIAEEDETQSPAATMHVTQQELPPTIVEPEGDWLTGNQPTDGAQEPNDLESLDNPLHHVATPRVEEPIETLQR